MPRPITIIILLALALFGTLALVVFLGGILESARVVQLPGEFSMFPDEPGELPSVIAPPPPPAVIKPLDDDPSEPLANPPAMVKAVYATSWSAGNRSKMDYLMKLIQETELNAIVIDIKDYTGYVAYRTALTLPKEYNAVELRISKLNALLGRLHHEGIYVIARVSVFQDIRLALARPDLAITSSSTGAVWKDRKGLTWMDPASREVWEYNTAIAREAFERGFDEVNFDYIRFPSDGNLLDLKYPVWDGKPGAKVLGEFWSYLRSELPDRNISADLFGLTTIDPGDLGIGQRLAVAIPHFDYIAPMVYPSHYAPGVFGFAKPADHPYEVVSRSLEGAIGQIKSYERTYGTTTPEVPPLHTAKLRPWLQDFDLGAVYDAPKVQDQIRAVMEIASSSPEYISGWMLWSPTNVYTREALGNTSDE
ncbi:MAG: putative glycoside hydrolase [Patescibacteria group bacterium]